MSLWAVIPVKPLHQGKSRLSGVLSAEERLLLNRCLLENLVDVLRNIPEINHVLVISRDPKVLAIARAHGARTLMESKSSSLNLALERAREVIRHYAASAMLVLPDDLPLASAQDIRTILDVTILGGREPPVVAVVPDRHEEGTNALLVSPLSLFQEGFGFRFGPASFQSHCEQARQVGARLEICHLSSLALDIDLPEDLALLRQIQSTQNSCLQDGWIPAVQEL